MVTCKLAFISAISLANALPALLKRDDSNLTSSSTAGFIQQELYSGPDFNAIQVSIGSDNQTVLLRLDVSSPTIWVNSALNEFCSAYYPLDYSNSSSWNELNTELQKDVNDAYESYQIDEASKINQASNSAQLSSYGNEAKTKYESFLSEQQLSIDSKLSMFVQTATGSIPSSFETLGYKITSKAGALATTATSWGKDFATDVTSIGGSLYTFVSEKEVSKASAFNSKAGHFATSVTSEFGDLTGNVLGQWGKITKGFSDGILLKREESGFPSSTVLSVNSVTYSSSYSFVPQPDSLNSTSNQTLDSGFSLENLFLVIQNDCSLYGVFNDSSSESFETDNIYAVLSAGDDFASGIWGNDSLTISNVTVNTTIGIADISDTNIGIFGIGKSLNSSPYKSYPDILAEKGEIGKSFYSLFLGDEYSEIIFGGISTDYFEGNITLFPLLNTSDALAITLSELNVTLYHNDTQFNETIAIVEEKTPALIDTLINPLLLPESVLESLVGALNSVFNVTYSETYGRFLLTDKPDTSNITTTYSVEDSFDINDILLSFNFQGSVYDIPIDQFVEYFDPEDIAYYNTSTPYSQNITNSSFYFNIALNSTTEDDDNDYDDDENDYDDDVPNVYLLNILPSGSDAVILGLDFFQDTIVLFVDLEDEVVGFANNVFGDSCDTDYDDEDFTASDDEDFNFEDDYSDDDSDEFDDTNSFYNSTDGDDDYDYGYSFNDTSPIILIDGEIPFAVNAPDYSNYYGS